MLRSAGKHNYYSLRAVVWLGVMLHFVLVLGRQGSSASSTSSGTSQHTVNFAVVVSTSRFYHNYRHVTNALTVYNTLRLGGIPDSHIILMLADDIPCDSRNPEPNSVVCQRENLFPSSVEVDYRGNDVTVDNFIRVLTGRHVVGTPPNRRLPYYDRQGQRPNILLYLTGHGGDKFIKFQDAEEVTSRELAQAFAHMNSLHRYNEILFVSDTCQAFTLADEIHADNVISIGSSLRGENSYGHHVDQHYGVAVIDSFTFAFHSFTKAVPSWQKRSIKDWIDTATFAKLNSHVGFTDRTSQRKINTIPMSDFFTMKVNNPHASTAGGLVKPLCIKDDSLPNLNEDFYFSSTQDINGSAESKSNIIDDSFHVASYQILKDMLSLSHTTQQKTMLSSRTFTPEFLVHNYSAFTANIWTVYIVYGLVIFVTTILFIVTFLATVGEDVWYTNENNYEGQLHYLKKK